MMQTRWSGRGNSTSQFHPARSSPSSCFDISLRQSSPVSRLPELSRSHLCIAKYIRSSQRSPLVHFICLRKQTEYTARIMWTLLAQAKLFSPVKWKVPESDSSLTLTLLQKKPSLKYHHHHNCKAISCTVCHNKNYSSCCQRESHSLLCTYILQDKKSSLHLLTFRPNFDSFLHLCSCMSYISSVK